MRAQGCASPALWGITVDSKCFPRLSAGMQLLSRCFLPRPLPLVPRLRLRLRECHITTVPAWCQPLLHDTFGFSLQFSQASVIRSYTKFVMGVCRQLPCPVPSSCHLWAESSCSGGTGCSVLDIPYPRITLLTCKSWK